MQFSAVSVFLNILIEPTLDLLITPYKRKIYNQLNRTKNKKKRYLYYKTVHSRG